MSNNDKLGGKTAPPTTAGDLQNLTLAQLQELQGVLKNPISGREVMIPLTSQAFVIGSLQPDKDASGEERLVIRSGGELKEMSRKEICEGLEQEKQQQKNKGGNKKSVAIKDKIKPASCGATKGGNAPDKKKSTSTGGVCTEPGLPYFDIKEELDGKGNVVSSEAVNVTKQLEFVAKQAKSDDDGEFKEDVSEPDSHSQSVEYELPVGDDDNDTPSPVTDEEYQALSARLDELARLEEEAEAKTAVNQKSARKLQGDSWSKGFLSRDPPAKGIPKQQHNNQQRAHLNSREPVGKDDVIMNPVKQQSASTSKTSDTTAKMPAKEAVAKTKEKSKMGWSKGFLKNSSPSSKAKGTKPKVETSEPIINTPVPELQQESSKKVTFHQNIEEVREIPKVAITASLQRSRDDYNNCYPPSSSTSSTPRPFENSVFSGVVKERPIGRNDPPLNQAPTTTSSESKPKKKLSKFAQERLQNL